ncbi:bifunctional acetate--CoA ligase family protein/GNAT family N-acetyltransferase [Candidatus Albibeggiatoa sp. nov. NOAA]|uniref:bifunctional acetate--CoA ligase family protein/GNAT family N-acetyltransferase n=1 Tax=Candidatus Albibeggiatoa sp. nov. NOAA TaxID=3162724 RepID=UPI0033015CE7|nr:bifunctional acetate--CoA ligase family protein/GNAT family N-acetyltransferase [Thiotrichaceae bacterium]
MSQHYLTPLFAPKSIAVFGASSSPDSVGSILFKNLLDGGFKGAVYAINIKYEKVLDQKVYRNIKEIGKPVDLVIITTPARTIPQIIEACGEVGVKTAVILSAGFREAGAEGVRLEHKIVEIAKRYGIRFIGPNALGIMRPSINFNGTFFKGKAKKGNLALISQSGALCTAVLDWAESNNLGFSAVVSVGTSADLDFGQILDFLVSDPQTHGILLYIEGIHHARSFMSGLRAAARIKPVIVIKSGRYENVSQAVTSHSGALFGRDDAFDSALQRAGVVRVSTFGQLFSAAKTLASRYKAQGNRLAIITNGGGPGVMATDRATELGIPLADLSKQTINSLHKVLPPKCWSKGNPIDIVSDATPQRYKDALTICLDAEEVDALIVILTPQAMTEPVEVAKVIIEMAKKSTKPIITCWMGGVQVGAAQKLFAEARIPDFRLPESAVESFYFLSSYDKNQQLLLQAPSASTGEDAINPDTEGTKIIIESVLAERRKVLTEMESKALLGAFKIPVVTTAIARTANEALVLAESMGFPIVMKINSPDITHKSDVGGVKLNIHNAQAVRDAFKCIMKTIEKTCPKARLDGVTVERMINKPNGRELMVGIVRDPVFGPVISFGMGGTMVEVLDDVAVSLPPLNNYLVKTLIDKTNAAKLLATFRQMPPAHREALEQVLLRVSEMACELPWIREMDINPLIIDEKGVVAVDARIVVDYCTPNPDRYAHMAIYPYPAHLVEQWHLPDGTDMIIRPIRPEDADIEQEFVRDLSDEAKYFRFMQSLSELTPTMLVRFTQIDYDREMALIAVTTVEGKEVEVGVVRYSINPDGESCEFALVVSDRWQHRGIAHRLMTSLMNAARHRGLKMIEGEVLSNNHSMLKLMDKLGFNAILDADDRNITLVSRLL